MKVKNIQAYEEWKANNTDPYGLAIFRYAERWADMMEERIANGEKIENIAKELSHKADTEGITGFMYGCAVGILSECWEYGEELRKWHNKKYNYMYDSKEDTLNHIINVRKYAGILQNALFEQTSKHDKSKLEEPEKPIFDEYTPKLKNCVYGSDEYKTYLKEMQVALKHHYANNRHHPEHFENGIKDMTLVDLCEMIADWKAATLRHNNGNIIESIELNQKRFNYSDELKQILINTVNMYFK